MSPTEPLQYDAIVHLNNLAGQLITLIEQENTMVMSADRVGFLSLQARKAQVAREYELTMKAIRATKADLYSCEPALRQELKERHARLQQLSAENVSILARAQGTVRRLQDRILNAARQAAKADESPNYTSNGKAAGDADAPIKPTSYSEAV